MKEVGCHGRVALENMRLPTLAYVHPRGLAASNGRISEAGAGDAEHAPRFTMFITLTPPTFVQLLYIGPLSQMTTRAPPIVAHNHLFIIPVRPYKLQK
jgi:hypothetical protein